MSFAIRVADLGKRYRIGGPQAYRTVRDTISGAVRHPVRTLRARRQRAAGDDMWALRNVSFEVRRGEVIGIIGRNGAGKSTLLKVLSRITEPTEGRAEVTGRVGSLLEVGTGFHPELTGRENIFLSGAILGMKRSETVRKFDEMVAFAEVDRFIDTPLKFYSSGMYLRLAFAVAAHLEPAILMVDEVLAVGDVAFQRKCLGKMQEVGESGQTVLFVSHDLTAISRLAPKSLVLQGGTVQFYGPTVDAIRLYSEARQNVGEELRTRLDRTGDGVIRLEQLRFRTSRGHVETVGSGESIVVEIQYSSGFTAVNYEDIALDMRFTDMLGHPIATLSTRFCHYEAGPLSGVGTLYCHIPSFALAAETYAVDLWLAYKGALADYIVRAAELRVITAQYFETGQEPVKRKHGAALLRHSWSATERAQDAIDDAPVLSGAAQS